MRQTRLKAVLIDIDGTLLDSNDAHTRSWIAVLARHGHDVPYDKIRPLIGKGGDKLLQAVVGFDDETDEGRQIAREAAELFARDHLHVLKPTPGARALLERMRGDGLMRVVATSAGGDELKGLLRQAGIEDLIDDASTSSDADASKPDPDIVSAALQKAGVRADEALMLGDTPFDTEAARKAGVDTVSVRCGGWWDDAALRDAVAIYDDPAALLSAWAESPFSRGTARSAR